MGGFFGVEVGLSGMAAKQRPALGIKHVTVVPTNFEVDEADDEDEAGEE